MMRACQSLPQGELCIIFTNTKRMADRIQSDMQRSRIPAVAIHGDKDQRTRDMALADFKEKRVQVMVATDVAARGLDIKNVKMVVNFDPPNNAEDYVHRIGRTGRAGQKGEAYTFLKGSDSHIARQILQHMQKAGQQPPAALREVAGGGGGFGEGKGGGKGGGKSYQSNTSGGWDNFKGVNG